MQAGGYSSLGDYLTTFHPFSIKSAVPRRAELKTSFLLSGGLSLSLTLTGAQPEALAWKIICLPVSLMNVNITQLGAASKPPCGCGALPLGQQQICLQAHFLKRDFIIKSHDKEV